jgi:hypothetical protein
MARVEDPTERFVALVSAPARDVRLDHGALLIAAHVRPGLEVGAWCAHLDDLARRCPQPTFDALRRHLFVSEGFAGNTADYSDPENSFLDSVLTRRVGIPITLAVVVMEVGRRIGVDVRGIGMPGHFLVADAARPGTYCDPFHGGRTLEVEDCRALFSSLHGAARPFDPAVDLAPVTARDILARMLANLEHGPLGGDPLQLAWMCRLHLGIPDLSVQQRVTLARRLATLDEWGAADEYERVAAATGEPAATQLRAEARRLRARAN